MKICIKIFTVMTTTIIVNAYQSNEHLHKDIYCDVNDDYIVNACSYAEK